MDLMPIANKLEFEGLGVQGSTLFINFMPDECKEGILLRSPLIGTKIDPNLPGYYKTEFMVVVRTPRYESGLGIIKDAMTALTLFATDIDDIHIKGCYPRNLPATFPVSDGNYFELQVVFEVVYCGTAYGYPA